MSARKISTIYEMVCSNCEKHEVIASLTGSRDGAVAVGWRVFIELVKEGGRVRHKTRHWCQKCNAAYSKPDHKDRMNTVLRMREVGGLTYKAIADILGVSVTRARAIVQKAKWREEHGE